MPQLLNSVSGGVSWNKSKICPLSETKSCNDLYCQQLWVLDLEAEGFVRLSPQMALQGLPA